MTYVIGKGLYEAVLHGYDDVLNILHLLHGVRLALDGAELAAEDQYAFEEIVKAAERIGYDLKAKIEAGSQVDRELLFGNHALAKQVVEYLAGSVEPIETPESLAAQGLSSDAELLRMALEVLGK